MIEKKGNPRRGYLPDQRMIDSSVAMNEDMTLRDDRWPRDLGVRFLESLGNLRRSFSDDLHGPFDAAA